MLGKYRVGCHVFIGDPERGLIGRITRVGVGLEGEEVDVESLAPFLRATINGTYVTSVLTHVKDYDLDLPDVHEDCCTWC